MSWIRMVALASCAALLSGCLSPPRATTPVKHLQFTGPDGKTWVWPADKVKEAQGKCDVGDARTCFLLALAFGEGPLAFAYYEKACEGGVADGCKGAALLHREGKGGVLANQKEGIRFLVRACDEGEARACADVSQAYFTGQQMPQDRTKALDYARRACDGGHAERCRFVGLTYYLGEAGIAKDANTTADVFRRQTRWPHVI